VEISITPFPDFASRVLYFYRENVNLKVVLISYAGAIALPEVMFVMVWFYCSRVTVLKF
jgi:hypothetical protein